MKGLLIAVGVVALAFLAFGAMKRSGRTDEQNAQADAIRTCWSIAKAAAYSPDSVAACRKMDADYVAQHGKASGVHAPL